MFCYDDYLRPKEPQVTSRPSRALSSADADVTPHSDDVSSAGGDAAADADAAGVHDADAEQLQYGDDHAGTGGE